MKTQEPKQDLEKEMFDLEQELDIPSNLRWHNSKLEQETLEEADEIITTTKFSWEADKKMYSEEKVLEQLNLLYGMKNSLVDTFTDENDYITMKWFEQFKKNKI